MKLHSNITVTPEEAIKFLTKFVEKKTGKKVQTANFDETTKEFVLQLQTVDVEEPVSDQK